MTRSRHFLSVATFMLFGVAACTNEETLGDRDASTGALPTGTLAGRSFTPSSGFAQLIDSTMCEGHVILAFGSEQDTCEALRSRKMSAGATLVTVFSTCGTKPSTYDVLDVEVYAVDPTCKSGDDLDKATTKGAELDGARVTFTRVGPTRVEGSLSFGLEDGSTFAGDFSVPTCFGAFRSTTVGVGDASADSPKNDYTSPVCR